MFGFAVHVFENSDFQKIISGDPLCELRLHLNCALDSPCVFTHGVHNIYFQNYISYIYICIYVYMYIIIAKAQKHPSSTLQTASINLY